MAIDYSVKQAKILELLKKTGKHYPIAQFLDEAEPWKKDITSQTDARVYGIILPVGGYVGLGDTVQIDEDLIRKTAFEIIFIPDPSTPLPTNGYGIIKNGVLHRFNRIDVLSPVGIDLLYYGWASR